MRALWLLLVALAFSGSSIAGHIPHKGGKGSSGPTGNSAAAFNWTLQNNNLCQASTIGSNFFVMFGNSSGPLITGVQKTALTPSSTYPTYGETTTAQMDSASKGISTTLYAELRGRTGTTVNWTPYDIAHLHQADEGYTNASSTCTYGTSVASCLNATGQGTCTASPYGYISTSGGAVCTADAYVFSYSGTHFNINAVANSDSLAGLKASGAAPTITTLLTSTLGLPTAAYPNAVISYYGANLAGNGTANADGAAQILQNIVNGTYVMRYAINKNNVPTNFAGNTTTILRNSNVPTETAGNYIGQKLNGTLVTSTTTLSLPTVTGGSSGINYIVNGQSKATSSPIPENWQYTTGGWVETDPAANGDWAWSSPGSKGFVIWIDYTFNYWGVFVAQTQSGGQGYAAEQCDRLLRCAYKGGNYQSGTIPTSDCAVSP